MEKTFVHPGRDPGPSYGGVRGLQPLGFEGPKAVWSKWDVHVTKE